MVDGERVGQRPALADIRARARQQVASLPEEIRRLRNPEIYAVGLSPRLASEKVRMIRQAPGVLPGAPGNGTYGPPSPAYGSVRSNNAPAARLADRNGRRLTLGDHPPLGAGHHRSTTISRRPP